MYSRLVDCVSVVVVGGCSETNGVHELQVFFFPRLLYETVVRPTLFVYPRASTAFTWYCDNPRPQKKMDIHLAVLPTQHHVLSDKDQNDWLDFLTFCFHAKGTPRSYFARQLNNEPIHTIFVNNRIKTTSFN